MRHSSGSPSRWMSLRPHREPTPRSNIFKTTNFTGQTNALAVEKHMMAYIETELAKRKGGGQVDAMAELAKLDPHDELYRIAEKYQVDQRPCVFLPCSSKNVA